MSTRFLVWVPALHLLGTALIGTGLIVLGFAETGASFWVHLGDLYLYDIGILAVGLFAREQKDRDNL